MTTSARAATGTSPSSVNMTTRERTATNAACSIADHLVVSVKSEITSARPSGAFGAAAAIIDNSNSSNAGGSSTNEAPDQDSKLNILVNIGNQDSGNNSNDHDSNENDNSGSSSNQQQQQQQQQETNEPSAVEPVVSPIASRGQSQVVLQGVDAPAPVGLPAGRRRRRARMRDVGDDCIANRTRARAGRHGAHRVEGVRATRSRVRAGEAYLVAGIT